MKRYIIAPKEFTSERFVMEYFDYTKKEAITLYRARFPQFQLKEIEIYGYYVDGVKVRESKRRVTNWK